MAQGERHAEKVIAPDRLGPAAARRFVAAVLDGWGVGGDVDPDVAALLASEVVTNAVVHGSGPVRVAVHRFPTGVRVQVADTGPGRPQLTQPGEEAQGGRGLMLVDTLSSGWGVRPDDPGKVVWFDLEGGADRPAPDVHGRAARG